MTSLVQYHEQHKGALREQLGAAQTPGELFKAVQDYLSKLTDLSGEYVSGLTRSQARVALAVLGLVQRNLDAVSSGVKPPVAASPPVRLLAPAVTAESKSKAKSAYHAHRPEPSPLLPSVGAIAGIGTAGVIAGIISNPFLAAAVGIACGLGAAAITQGIAHTQEGGNGAVEEAMDITQGVAHTPEGDNGAAAQAMDLTSPARAPIPPAAVDLIEGSLAETFKTLDTMLDEYAQLEEAARPRPVTPQLEDHQRILEFLQDLLGWYARKKDSIPDDALQALRVRLEEQLPDLLSEYRIQIKPFDLGSGERDLAAFDFEQAVEGQKFQTPQVVRPAFVKDSAVLLKGRVVKPGTGTQG